MASTSILCAFANHWVQSCSSDITLQQVHGIELSRPDGQPQVDKLQVLVVVKTSNGCDSKKDIMRLRK